MLLVAGCDSARDESPQPVEPKVAPGSGTSDSGPVTTGPKGEAQTLPAVPGGNEPSDSGRASAATNPTGDLSKAEEQKKMPLPGQANTHSSEALSKDAGTASDGEPAGGPGGAPAAGAAGSGAGSGAASGAAGAAGAAAAGAAAAGSNGGATQVAAAGDPEALLKKHNCVSCHAIDKKLVGPAYKEVAAKYKGDATAAARLVDKVKKGGSGVWGPIPMPPNPTVPDGDVKAIVDWILAGAS